jgi:hypothetical protein
MANLEHLAILTRGVEIWNEWREKNAEIQPDFNNADLRGVVLRKANLHSANLVLVRLDQADLRGANLRDTDLRSADLIKADLRDADLVNANLSGANLCGADLENVTLGVANLSGANLCGVNLRGAQLMWTVLGGINLTAAKGLDACKHVAPSVLDHKTLIRSGRLPLAFLRGCGLPDALIDYLPALLNEPLQLYSVFISYSHHDEAFAQRLHDALQAKDVRCWYAPEDIQGGKKIHEQIDAAIRIYDKLLLILSEHSMQSEWVKTELANARRREVNENKRLLFPIRLVDFETIRTWTCFDADTGKDSAREIREYFIPDFSNWKDHASFEHAFTRLLRDLKAD